MQGLESRDFHERLIFEMADGICVTWPVYTVLRQDYTTILLWSTIGSNKKPIHGRHIANDIQQQICKIRKDKAVDEDMPYKG